jgi:hypothetical protein
MALGALGTACVIVACSSTPTPTLDAGAQPVDGGLGNYPDGYVDPNDPVAQCQTAGGAVASARCCNSSADFPDQCKPGACSCDPAESKETRVCTCPGVDFCWNGKRCIPL